MSDFDDHLAAAYRFHRSLAALRAHQQFVRDALARHGYDPSQPRVPAGHREGGQWTTTGSGTPASGGARREVEVDRSGEESWGSYVSSYRDDGSLAEQRVFNRDGSRIVSEFNESGAGGWDERHTVVLPDGRRITFENTGDVQRIYDANGRLVSASAWTNSGPEPEAVVQPAFAPAVPLGIAAGAVVARASVQAALLLFTWLASRDSPDRKAVVALPARVYEPVADPKRELAWVGVVSGKELEQICKKYKDVQKFTNLAAAQAKIDRTDWSPSGYGTEVHKRVARAVNGTDEKNPDKYRSPNSPEDPNFVAEFSAWKTKLADSKAPAPTYGKKGTVRFDVLENRPEQQTVCVYDLKTGERGLLPGRYKEIASSVFKHFGNVARLIITEVRPQL